MSAQNILASNGKIEPQFIDGAALGFVSNPMTADLECANYHINNAGRVNTTEINADNLSLLPGSGLTAIQLHDNIQGNNNYISGMYAPPFGTSAIVCAGTDTFLIEDTSNVPLLAVANTGLILGGGGTAMTVPVQAPTVVPSSDSSTKVATTAFVQSAISGAAAPTLSSVLTAGNTATNSITLNNTGVGANTIKLLPNNGATDPHIEISDGTTTNTIDKNGYTTRNSVQNTTHYLNFSDSSATGTGAIQKTAGISCNPSTNIVSATTFSGALSGNATSATNLAGGLGGSIPYQSAVDTTALLANGTAGQVLTSQGTTLAPIWASASAGATVNSISQVYNEDFVELPFTFTAQNYPFALNSFNYTDVSTSYPDRSGVYQVNSTGSTSCYIITTTLHAPVSINTDTSGLGFTFIMKPGNPLGTSMWVGFNNSYNVSPMPLNPAVSAMFVYNSRWVNWGCQIGDIDPVASTFPGYFVNPATGLRTGTLVDKWCVFRIVPLSSGLGLTFYLTNETDNITYTPITWLYSQQTATTVSNTSLMNMGFGMFNWSFSAVDYMGLQVAKRRIYP